MRTLTILSLLMGACSSPAVPLATPDAAADAAGPEAADAPGSDAAPASPDADATDAAQADVPSADVATATCALPETFTQTQRIVTLAVTDQKVTVDGKQYLDGCDLDGDGLPNNVLGKVASLYKDLNKTLHDKLADGTLALAATRVLQPEALELVTVKPQGSCDPQVSKCPIVVERSNYLPGPSPLACAAKWRMVPGKEPGTWERTTVANVAFLSAELGYTVVVHSAKWLSEGTSGHVRICGVLSNLQSMMECGGDPGCQKILKPDIDTDGDGENDALSFSLDLTTAPAGAVSLAPAP